MGLIFVLLMLPIFFEEQDTPRNWALRFYPNLEIDKTLIELFGGWFRWRFKKIGKSRFDYRLKLLGK